MKFLDLTLAGAASNLALDEALLDHCEAGGGGADEILRVWEPEDYFVVLGYANRLAAEVDLATCAEKKIPIFRRCSGGGTVLQGPGCLNYSLCLRIGDGDTGTVTGTNRLVMERHCRAFQSMLSGEVKVQGHTDLTRGDLKFSGNAQRRRRSFLIFHGTFLLRMDLSAITGVLKMPTQQPEYRRHRSHADFLTNLELPVARVKNLLRNEWQAGELLEAPPSVEALVGEKYSREEWNRKS